MKQEHLSQLNDTLCELWDRALYMWHLGCWEVTKSLTWGLSCSSLCWVPERPQNHKGICLSDLYSAAWQQKKNSACCGCCSAASHSSNYTLCRCLQIVDILSKLRPATLLTLVCWSLLCIVEFSWSSVSLSQTHQQLRSEQTVCKMSPPPFASSHTHHIHT